MASPVKFGAIRAFRTKLAQQNRELPVVGMGVTLSDGMLTDALCDSLDWLWLDLEHNTLSPETLRNITFIAHGHNVPCFVRIAGPNHLHSRNASEISAAIWSSGIKQVLDMGCDGVVVPEVRTREDVVSAVRDCKYPLFGRDAESAHNRRGFSKIIGSNYGRLKINDKYVREANESVFVAVMIETREAYENIEDICAVEGLDAVMIGMGDFRAALEMDYGASVFKTPSLLQAVDKIIDTAGRFGKQVIYSSNNVKQIQRMMQTHPNIKILKIGDDTPSLVKYTEGLKGNIKKALQSKL